MTKLQSQLQGTISFEYDDQGNTLREVSDTGTKGYGYDIYNRTVGVKTADGHSIRNVYDPIGLRAKVERDDGQSKFVFSGWSIVAELDNEFNVKAREVRGYGLLEKDTDGQKYYYHHNEHGDVTALTNVAEEIRNSYEYDVFGNTVGETESIENHFRYAGEQFDCQTDQYYLRARFYNAKLGRFTQEDVYRSDGLNLYSYVLNNPIMWIDPSGFATNYDPNDYVDPSTLPGLSAGERKTTPGIATGAFTSSMPVEGSSIRSEDLTTIAISQEVAQQIVGKQYSSFDALKADIYKGIANSQYASEFSSSNQTTMSNGRAPFAIDSLTTGDDAYNQLKYNIHHIKPVEDGGDIYNLDNLAIVAPKTHNEIHEEIDAKKRLQQICKQS